MRGLTGIGHIAVKVSDLQRSLDYYTRLGLKEMTRLTNDKGEAWIVYLRLSDTQFLELFPGAKTDRAPADDGSNGVNHLCWTTDDLDATVAGIEAAGLKLRSPISKGLDGNRGAWIEDPDGNRIELMEMAPDCLQYRAIEALRQTA